MAYISSQSQDTLESSKKAVFRRFFGEKKCSWQNGRLSPLACHTYSESYACWLEIGYIAAISVHPMRRQNFAGKLHHFFNICHFAYLSRNGKKEKGGAPRPSSCYWRRFRQLKQTWRPHQLWSGGSRGSSCPDLFWLLEGRCKPGKEGPGGDGGERWGCLTSTSRYSSLEGEALKSNHFRFSEFEVFFIYDFASIVSA